MALNLNQSLAWKSASQSEQQTLKNLQANILKSHGRNLSTLLFLNFNPGTEAEAKTFIKSLNVTDALTQLQETANFNATQQTGQPVICFLLSASGYSYLGLPPPQDAAFLAGMRSRQAILDDPASSTWEATYQQVQNPVHAIVMVADDDPNVMAQLETSISAQIANCGSVLAKENGSAHTNSNGDVVEHFGFVDGRSIPLMLVEDIQKENTTTWNSAFPLSQVLVQEPGDTQFENLGSYFVFRKLEQNVAGWNQAVVSLSQTLGIAPALAGAYAVGRFQDGTPVVQSSTPQAANLVTNDFVYATDPGAARCPFHAHIRKTNPRGDTVALGATVAQEREHLLVRRGMSYGSPTDPTNPPTTGVGLLFMAYNSDLQNQFEFVQQSWANNNGFAAQNTGQDPVIGQGANLPNGQSWPKVWGNPQPGTTGFSFAKFVTMKGGEYFFAPSIGALKNIV